MAMTWDSPLVAGVAGELRDLLDGARLRAHVFDWDRREITLYFRSCTLNWHLHPEAGWVLVHPASEPPEEARPLAAEVGGVEAPPDERRLLIHMRRARGKSRTLALAFELMTNQWNALLLEGEEARIRHLLWTRRLPDRTLSVGEAYRPPPPSDRIGVDPPLTREEWSRLASEPAGTDDGEGQGAFLSRVAFTSPLNLPALLAGEDSGADPPPGSPLAGYSLWRKFRTLRDMEPHLLVTTRGKQCYPYLLQGFEGSPQPSLLAAMAAQAGEDGEAGGSRTRAIERAERALGRARGRLKGIRRELEDADDPEEVRDRANLILARLADIPPGTATISLEGFQGEPVEISLDPALSPQENAQALYEEAARRDRAREALPGLLEEAREKVREMEVVVAGLVEGSLSPEEALGILPDPGRPQKGPAGGSAPRLPYRRYRSSGGIEIRVGKRGSDNDELTFHHARPDHIWMHAREAQGAHVVLCWEGEGNPPARDLTEAASLAALNSRARRAGVVPVDWTRRKYVRKPRKAPPGTVVPDRVRTLFVEPSQDLEERLAWRD